MLDKLLAYEATVAQKDDGFAARALELSRIAQAKSKLCQLIARKTMREDARRLKVEHYDGRPTVDSVWHEDALLERLYEVHKAPRHDLFTPAKRDASTNVGH